MRFAGTTQISVAINNLGITRNQKFSLIVIGEKQFLNKLYKNIFPSLVSPFSNNNSVILKNHFNISKKNLDAIDSKTQLEDFLVEKGVIARADLDLFKICDTVDEAYKYLTKKIRATHLRGPNF